MTDEMTSYWAEKWLSEKIAEGNEFALRLRADMDALRKQAEEAYAQGALDETRRHLNGVTVIRAQAVNYEL